MVINTTSKASELDPEMREEMHKAEVLGEMEPLVEKLMNRHKEKRRLWWSDEFLPASEKTEEGEEHKLDNLRERAQGINDSTKVSLLVNLLTEEGLPHFHRILSKYLGDDSFWSKWNFMWTAEEDRHGAVIRDYVRDSRIMDFTKVEQMQFQYQEAGFEPAWDSDPYRVFVYTTLQERATQVSHQNTGKMAGNEDEPVLHGILKHVAADEAKHYIFYRDVFKGLLDLDPDRALQSAATILPSIDMPGLTMPNFNQMADVIRRVGIYGPWDYKDIVQEAVDYWKIGKLTSLNEAGRKAQEKIMKIPARLEKVAKYIERKAQKKTFSFDFINNRQLAFE
jgi:acyl-[acyl-carrier-protein] desaturase